jgi:pre-rRNA-processing protein IPI3
MLSEQILASISISTANNGQSASGLAIPPIKDAAIFQLSTDPYSRNVPRIYKSSITNENALAFNQSHIFAAQADKSAIHVYNIEKGNQELIIPLPEKISSITTAGHNGEYLIIGSESGNVFVWEVQTISMSST